MRARFAIALVAAACGPRPVSPQAEAPTLVVAAIRGDAAAVRAALAGGADPNTRGPRGDTALMLAARYGDAELVELLLDSHADPNLANPAGATALHWSIDDRAKVDALLAHGATPDPVARSDYSPLMLAAYRDDGDGVIRALLDRGADPNRATDGGQRAIDLAAGASATSLRLLLDRGADARAKTAGAHTPLHTAAAKGTGDTARLLVERGVAVDVRDDNGRTPLMWAAQMGRDEIVQLLLAHGANPNGAEAFSGTTALMQAAASDRADLAIVDALLAAGADVAAVDDEGASALTWAIRRGDPDVVAAIAARETTPRGNPVSRPEGVRAGATNTTSRALARSLPLLERAGPAWRKQAGCPSCHHDAFPAVALARAKARGLAVDDAAQRAEAAGVVAALRPLRDRMLLGVGFADVVEPAYFLFALDAARYPPDEMTDAMTRYLALRQTASGAWRAQMQRLPMDGSDISFTALAARALSAYAPRARATDTAARIARARDFLAHAAATTTEDLAFQALGLRWTAATDAQIAPAIAALRRFQRDDGGFAQRGSLASDAYATAQAIVALREGGGLPANDPQIRRAVRFLLADQIADGSWFVASRALPFQPFFDSGFPQGRSQYISAGATAWAVWALAVAGE